MTEKQKLINHCRELKDSLKFFGRHNCENEVQRIAKAIKTLEIDIGQMEYLEIQSQKLLDS